MGIFGDLFGKKPHDPAHKLIDWLKDKPVACRSMISYGLGPHRYAGQVLDWILTRPDCDRGTAAVSLWEALQKAPAELAAARADPASATPNFDLASRIIARWNAGHFATPLFGCDSALYWSEFCKKLRKYRLSAEQFNLPSDIRNPMPGEFAHWVPPDNRQKALMDDLTANVQVCDLTLELPEHWLPIRKKRLGY